MTDTNILVLGAGGQLGRALCTAPATAPADTRLIGRTRDQADITDTGSVEAAIGEVAADLIINAAAYTAVDQAESDADAAFAVNRDGAAIVAECCAKAGCPLIHLSTDYVLNGENAGPNREDDAIAPIGVYGRSKAAREAAVLEAWDRAVIVRTAWVFSAQQNNFLTTMLRLGGERDAVSVVADQRGGPTAAADIATAVLAIAAAILDGKPDGFGVFHYCGAPATTWHGFAQAIFEDAERLGLPVPKDVVPITTKDYPTPARRPANSVLDCRRIAETYGITQPDWRIGVRHALATLTKEK
ncbi:MAG: dTDP-4-dehydrorhamnose reductase [Alphaproteobacteria bacterium]